MKGNMESLPISPYFKRRIKEEAVRNYLTSERQKSLHPFKVAPTSFALERFGDSTITGGNRESKKRARSMSRPFMSLF